MRATIYPFQEFLGVRVGSGLREPWGRLTQDLTFIISCRFSDFLARLSGVSDPARRITASGMPRKPLLLS